MLCAARHSVHTMSKLKAGLWLAKMSELGFVGFKDFRIRKDNTLTKKNKIEVQGLEVVFFQEKKEDFISLTDMARYRDAERSDYILQNWMRSRSAIEFMGLWEMFNNPAFNSIEFDGIKNMSGSNSFSLTPLPRDSIAW